MPISRFKWSPESDKIMLQAWLKISNSQPRDCKSLARQVGPQVTADMVRKRIKDLAGDLDEDNNGSSDDESVPDDSVIESRAPRDILQSGTKRKQREVISSTPEDEEPQNKSSRGENNTGRKSSLPSCRGSGESIYARPAARPSCQTHNQQPRTSITKSVDNRNEGVKVQQEDLPIQSQLAQAQPNNPPSRSLDPNRRCQIFVNVPNAKVSYTIGRSGSNIKAIRNHAGANLIIHTDGPPMRSGQSDVIIAGTIAQCRDAENAIRALAMDCPVSDALRVRMILHDRAVFAATRKELEEDSRAFVERHHLF